MKDKMLLVELKSGHKVWYREEFDSIGIEESYNTIGRTGSEWYNLSTKCNTLQNQIDCLLHVLETVYSIDKDKLRHLLETTNFKKK